jgi:hypothetical protein
MQLDPDYLRQHYAALSDEGLLEIDRADLVPAAHKIFDLEVASRNLVRPRDKRQVQTTIPGPPDLLDEETGDDEAEIDDPEHEREVPGVEEKPDWQDEAVEVWSYEVGPETQRLISEARGVVEAAGIPCYLDLCEIPEEDRNYPAQTHRWQIMVPVKQNLHATSVLERQLTNPGVEATWKSHLEALSDDELRSMTPEVVFCGLIDRLERVNRVYDEEIARRRLK